MPPTASSRSDPQLSNSLASLAASRTSEDGKAAVELAIIAYFHRLTSQMLSVLAPLAEQPPGGYSDAGPRDDPGTTQDSSGAAADADGENDALLDQLDPEGDTDDSVVVVDSRAVENMGLDVWNSNDAFFVQELMDMYFGRAAHIEGKGVEVCGVRVC